MPPTSTQERRQMSKQMREQENEREEAEDSDQDQGGGGMLGGNTTVSHAQGLKNRVELRGKLRVSASEAAANKLDVNRTVGDIAEDLKKLNKSFVQVDRPQEALIEAQILISHSDAAAQQAKKLKLDQNAFETDGFLASISKVIGNKRMRDEDRDEDDGRGGAVGDWTTIGWMGVKYSARVCLADFLLGPLAVSLKERNIVKRAKLVRDEAAKTKPKEIEKNGDQDQKETTRYALELNDILVRATTDYQELDPENANRGINFFEYVINPFSFSQTIENIFYTSFNIKEGFASLEVEENGLLTIMSAFPAGTEDAELGARKLQMVLEIDQDLWRDAIETFDIRECVYIPHREIAEDAR